MKYLIVGTVGTDVGSEWKTILHTRCMKGTPVHGVLYTLYMCILCRNHLSEKDPGKKREVNSHQVHSYNLCSVYQAQVYYEQYYVSCTVVEI